jgi:tRNA wybutosine-synthesizing protein 1
VFTSQLPLLTYGEVALHTSPGDCWLIVHGLVYDVTPFLKSHPGGQSVLLESAGKDATSEFEQASHPEYARNDMQEYLVGRLDKQSAMSASSIAAEEEEAEAADENDGREQVRVKFVYGSQLGAGQVFAERMVEACQQLSKQLSKSYLSISCLPMNQLDPEDLGSEEIVVFVVSTYKEGTPPDNAKFFCEWLQEASVDFRVGPEFLSKLTYAVLGLGNSLYDHNYTVVAKRMYQQLPKMGGTALCSLGLTDESISRPDQFDMEHDFTTWLDTELLPNLVLAVEQPKAFATKVAIARNKEKTALRAAARQKRKEGDKRKAREQKDGGDAKAAASEGEEDEEYASASDGENGANEDEDEGGSAQEDDDDEDKVVDIEQLGAVLTKQKVTDGSSSSSGAAASSEQKSGEVQPAARAMLTDQLRKNLSKQGYKLIGTHSGSARQRRHQSSGVSPARTGCLFCSTASPSLWLTRFLCCFLFVRSLFSVKLCRWTKAMLRGRGGCYKHTMYGIISYQCMEMTPSLACANKCVCQ